MTTYQIVSAYNNKCMVSRGGVENDALIYCDGGVCLEFEKIGGDDKCSWQLVGSRLYLNFRNITGAVKLYDEATSFKIGHVQDGNWWIYSLQEEQYMWLDDDEPYVTNTGDPKNNNSWWKLVPTS